MKATLRNTLIGWLRHFLVFATFLNISAALNYFFGEAELHADYLGIKQKFIHLITYLIHKNLHRDMLALAGILLLIDINYQYVFKKTSWIIFFLCCLSCGLLAFAIKVVGSQNALYPVTFFSLLGPILLISAYACSYALVRDYFYRYNRKKDISLQQSQNELDALKAQLNPHFLFNSLNYLYGTALKENAIQTADGIDKLSDLLRYTVNGMKQNFVALTDEIQFIENYLALQKARLPLKESIKVNVQINLPQNGLQVAPLLLLSFIENAFKHGINMDEDCYVDLRITIEKNWLTMQITNSIVKAGSQFKSSNTGLGTTRKRLDLLYPNNYSLDLTDNGTTYSATLKLNLTTQKR